MKPTINLSISPDIQLTSLTAEDSPKMAFLANDFNVARFLREVFPHPYTNEDAEAFLTLLSMDTGQLALGIRYRNELAGVIGAIFGSGMFVDNIEVGFWLGKNFWNKGITTATLSGFTDFLFTAYNARRLYAGVLEGNDASKKVLLKCGYRQEGFLKDAAYNRGEILSYSVFALLKNEWLTNSDKKYSS